MKAEQIQIGFCENGAGFGGAVISLAAFLEHIPAEFNAHIYTGIGTEQYRQLSRFGAWRHMAPTSLVSPQRLRGWGAPVASALDNVFNLLPYAIRYYRAFKRNRIELVYLNNDASCNLAAALGGRMAGLPLVLHARGFNANTKGTRWMLANVNHCIAVSNAVKANVVQLGLSEEKCTVVAEGLDLNIFQPRVPSAPLRAELGLADNQPVITLVGGLIDWKGQDVLLAAVPAIVEKFPDARFLLVGSAYGKDDAFARSITEQSRSLALSPYVRMLGLRQDIPDILALSTIVLHASTQPEPFGRTFLEGMAMGKPVIASNEGGPLDVIEHEADGLLIAPREPDVLAGAIIRLLSDPAFANRLAQQAAAKARAYSIERHADAIGAILVRSVHPPPDLHP